MPSVELIDQKILERFQKQVHSGKWATTYLFTGKEVERKKELALAFAKALNCTGKASADCHCSVCRRMTEGTFPDLKWYGSDEEAASIKIAEVRDFRNWLSLKPFEAKVKIFIFNGAERLTAEAQNALLKSIEEPPPGNVIIFFVPHAKSLFDTITSRAMEVKVPAFPEETVKKILIQEGISKVEADFLARASQGELARARQAHKEKWFLEKNKWIDQLVKSPADFLDGFQGQGREAIREVFDFLIEWTRDLLTYCATRDAENLIHMDRAELVEQLASKHDFESILELFESLGQIKKSIDDYANQKLVLTQAGILWEHFLKP
ncbi:MAG: hypothetical protein HY588_03525 [Candidatus Omnitrophica bacterium]|nr:hypothetical protein [Candidatus Omnitrophota bacterium]